MPKTISLDFDGTLCSYESGWQGPRNIPDPPVPGAIDFLLRLLANDWDVAIFSTRSAQWGGRRAMKKWLRGYAAIHWMDAMHWMNDLETRITGDTTPRDLWLRAGYSSGVDPIDEKADAAGKWLVKQIRWPKRKPAAFVGLDDRVIQFDGNFPSLDTLDNFKPWNKR